MVDHKIAIKRKRMTRIAAFIVLGIVVALAVLIIVAACVPMNLKPSLINDPDQIIVYNQSSEHGRFSSDEDQYATFMEKFNSMFKTNFLIAMFSGRLGDYEVQASNYEQSEARSKGFTVTKLENEVLKKGYYVQFFYREGNEQDLRKSNGDICTSSFFGNIALTYRSIYFTISEKDSVETLTMYVPVKLSNSNNETEYVLSFTQKANTSILYNALDEFERM